MATRGSGFDDEELAISLPPSQTRRSSVARRPPDVNVTDHDRPHAGPPPTTGPSRDKIRSMGSRLDQYTIVKTLGEGSFGKVKLAIHKLTGQKVALKIIARKKLISRDMTGRVEREIEFLQLLRHPHIIKLYTVIKDTNDIIMVLEYAAEELFDYIVQRGRMPENEARRFFQQMLCAVEYCHRYRVVHRDLKPENLLLDENRNVKIADFGLSNIMTDGNFLKTSCGSPNYAAPEVIGGKLYAGPEVDVWSCGVILYVLLVGRLPFDDDHIPSLFAKIAKGTYVVPNWMSHGAAALIRKMLVVNPVQRVTIEGIRQDPWFLKDLPDYLTPPVEPFFNTGIDPEKAIKMSDIAPNAPPRVQAKLHAEVTDKISKTMGYGKKDVQEALEAEEPSAIKDAYMIVRENKLMQIAPNLGADNPYFATSPVTDDANVSAITTGLANLNTEPAGEASPLASMSSARSAASTSTNATSRPGVSKVAILPSSLPAYHRAYAEAAKAGVYFKEDPAPIPGEPVAPPRDQKEKDEMSRRLKPHARGSQIRLDETGKGPQSLTPVSTGKKSKQVRWQFGIRSRSSPFEALLCIYKALKSLGCIWKEDKNFHRFNNLPEPTNPKEQLPADPWHIEVRWLTGKLAKATTDRKHMKPEDVTKEKMAVHSKSENADHQVVAVWIDIQIYDMGNEAYLVDFMLKGYENAEGYMLEEKDVTSPFPFLDLAAKLIMQLAESKD